MSTSQHRRHHAVTTYLRRVRVSLGAGLRPDLLLVVWLFRVLVSVLRGETLALACCLIRADACVSNVF